MPVCISIRELSTYHDDHDLYVKGFVILTVSRNPSAVCIFYDIKWLLSIRLLKHRFILTGISINY